MSRLAIIVFIAAFAADAFAAGVAFVDLSGLWLRQDVLNEWWFIVVVGLVVVAAVSVVMVVVGFLLRDLAVACWDFFIRHTSDRVRATLTILASGYVEYVAWEFYRAESTLYSSAGMVVATVAFISFVLWPILSAVAMFYMAHVQPTVLACFNAVKMVATTLLDLWRRYEEAKETAGWDNCVLVTNQPLNAVTQVIAEPKRPPTLSLVVANVADQLDERIVLPRKTGT